MVYSGTVILSNDGYQLSNEDCLLKHSATCLSLRALHASYNSFPFMKSVYPAMR